MGSFIHLDKDATSNNIGCAMYLAAFITLILIALIGCLS
jgi:hypothetical protein